MKIRTGVISLGILLLLSVSGFGQSNQQMTEPNIEIAKQWWPETPKKWTMVGWKEHITRFNVLYDGSIINHWFWLEKRRPSLPDPFAQFSFFPAYTIDGVPAFTPNSYKDYGDVVQGWNDSNAPVLWSEWPWQGYLLRKQIFAHVPGGQELQTGDEPLFAWVRLSVHYAADGLPLEPNPGFGIRINYLLFNVSMELKNSLNSDGVQPKYRTELIAEEEGYVPGQAFRILEPDGRIRLAVAPGKDCKAVFRADFPSENDSTLHVSLSSQSGSYVDILIPMLPTDRETFDQELALGYDEALKEAEAFWSKTPETAATFDVPEEYINQAIRRNLQFCHQTAEKDPETGETHVLTGAFGYSYATWATPISIALTGLLDTMGYHSQVQKYLKVFKDAQGTVKPPGEVFDLHPGYLGVPYKLNIVDWLPDHGALLWVISQHALLTDDPEFIEEYTPVIIKACEWIRYARQKTGHGGVEGVMPPAGASDEESRIQVTWTDGWIYKGLSTAVRFLKRTGHPRAAEFEAEADDYRNAYLAAFRSKAETMPKWRDDEGNERTLAPYALSMEHDWHYRHLFYLDTGPMHLVFAELMDADDPLMRDALAWFREGPPVKLYRPYGNLAHVPSLRYEMSSWEPCYSWNVFHSWRLGDRQHFLEGMYSQFAGAMSQQTYTVCESRGGIYANIFWMPTVYHARMSVIDDQIEENALHLLRLCPLAWLRTDREAKFENIPTEYGPVNLQAKLEDGGRELAVTFSSNFRIEPEKTVLHIPPVDGLETVRLNGRLIDWDGSAISIDIL